MKKSNILTLLSFILLIALTIGFLFVRQMPDSKTNDEAKNNLPTTTLETTTEKDAISETQKLETTEKETATKKQIPNSNKKINNDTTQFKNSLFIGDSRTVGLFEYGKISGADFFASTGMSVYNIHNQKIAIRNVGKVTLLELLNNKKYDKIYVMLGINEAGYNVNQTIGKYKSLIDYISEKAPDSKIIIQANLHVTNERSKKDKYGINNQNINSINNGIKNFADNKTIFYINPNPLFDDGTGSLDNNKTGDSAHLYAKYYAQWGRWIYDSTSKI